MKNSIFLLSIIFTVFLIGLPSAELKAQAETQTFTAATHEIFSGNSHDTRRNDRKTGVLIIYSMSFKKPYDSLFKASPEKFNWKVSGLPSGAKFNPNKKEFTWKPNVEQTGDFKVVFHVEFEGSKDSWTKEFQIKEEWNSYFIPGLSYVTYIPELSGGGRFDGISVEYILSSWIHRNENRGPSHGKFYLKLDMLMSNQDTISEGFNYALGVSMSLERNPQRSWLLPFVGLEFGGFYQKDAGNLFHLTPIFGAWIYSSQNLFVHLYAGYQFPTQKFEDYRGAKAGLGFNFSMW